MKFKILSIFIGIITCSSIAAIVPKGVMDNLNPPVKREIKSDHGERLELGVVKVLNKEFTVTQLGKLESGKEGAFEVKSNVGPSGYTAYIWVESKHGSKLSAPSRGIIENGNLHFHVLPSANSIPYKIVLRVREGATLDERASLPLSGHGHEHIDSPHLGVVSKLFTNSGEHVGHVELKLHDDKGDIELWVAKNEKIDIPLDLPLNSVVKVKFIDHNNKEILLKVRNNEKNEDEDGKINLRDSKTNYFIFPTSSDQETTWLKGKEFSSIVTVSIEADGKVYYSDELVLVPHSHAHAGHTH